MDKSGSQSKSKKAMLDHSLTDPTLVPTQPWGPTTVDSDDDHVTPASEVTHSRLSSHASTWSRACSTSKGMDSVLDKWPPGAFNKDEVQSSLQAARTAKKMQPSIASTGMFMSNCLLILYHKIDSTSKLSPTNCHVPAFHSHNGCSML